MLSYFLQFESIEQVKQICLALNNTKLKLLHGTYINATDDYKKCDVLFEEIKSMAIQSGDEQLANSQLVFRWYFKIFCNLIQYFAKLERKQYADSWVTLQDCLDGIKRVGRFTDVSNRFDLDNIYDLLLQYETLYPYSVFASSEYVISESHCSICGKSMQSLECPHIKGEIYWGEPAIEYIDKIDVLQAVCVVSHPEDKRCIIEVSDDGGTEKEKFSKLDQFLALNLPRLQQFRVSSIVERRVRSDIQIVGRKKPCPCGSGKRFKHCCGKDMYYEHLRYIVTPAEHIDLKLFA